MVDFSTLKTRVSDYLSRSDLSSYLDVWVNTALRRVERRNSFAYMYNTTSPTWVADTATVAIPTGFKEPIWWYFVNNDAKNFLEYVLPWEIDAKESDATPTSYPPRYFSMVGITNFKLVPTPDSAYTNTLAYYKYSTELSGNSDTNWLTDNQPEVLIYGTLLEAEPFLYNDQRMQMWQQMFQESMENIRVHDNVQRLAVDTRVMRRV
ncbi:MAG: phage adaptor protein [Candidatus Thorarchaeota archaeon]|jgi:hypothetical protein